MLSVKQVSNKYHFLSLWYDLTWDWNPISRTIDEYYTQFYIPFFEKKFKILIVKYCLLAPMKPSCTAQMDLFLMLYIYIYIYIYILFGLVKPELGVIPPEQENHSKVNL